MKYPWASEEFFNQFGLSKLAHHWPTLVLSTLTCQFIIYASRMISPLLFPKAYGGLKSVKRLSWDVHVVSLVHCLVICVLAFPLHWEPELVQDKVYGYSGRTGEVYAIASGYFLWDSIFHILHLKEFGVGFAVHGIACFCLGINSYRPFLMYFGCVFLMFELSTPFLNFHWFMDKLGYTGSMLQMINGVILITVFFCARLVWGFWSMYELIVTVTPILNQVPLVLTIAFALALGSLNILNVFWFRKMILSVGTRFEHSEKIKRN
ncbi:DUF887 family protein [Basidiobolus meristosporus CBS 931.73]|uniref:DUF887 family protein n=1 Tax=Basidiobolus meristosporus CBS 931.73 TaxID=1314790 RepID=A0A1Y1XZC2_9FUNG|nr:DUF887 family protein [Basidiobolus meristosporus CBS 931.73]|eukprot:ORX90714.1 DUF887 family protein [Basidiobolus meristosporus CBS 931.73]